MWAEQKKRIVQLIHSYTPLREAGNTFTIRKSSSGWITITFKRPLENGVTRDFIEGLLLGAGAVGTYYSDGGPMDCYHASLSIQTKGD